ncbi:bifunctional cytochrome P450/NADPH--P450 reductase (plasmid) [Streptomyces sp. BI20]|uniref:bifunctional cytochrome P450/NADPH--P450 reductase n=1 Tax=Streptomyces sp. BI20 TaxID=3403460 RepID=UPI003C70B053
MTHAPTPAATIAPPATSATSATPVTPAAPATPTTHASPTTPAPVVAPRIPERPALPLLGHALSVPSGVDGLRHLMREFTELGPIYRIRALGDETVMVAGPELVAELADETRFRKNVHPDLVEIRALAGDGLFTAFPDEPNWRKAHDILMPAFSLSAMRGYHGTMLDVARSLLSSWDRAAADGRPVDVAEDMTRLTFDTIGLCGFGHDFRSFEREDAHPFVAAMSRALAHTQAQGEALPGTGFLRRGEARRFRADVDLMTDLVDDVIRRRRASGDTRTDDLLGRMLHTPDPATGEPLDDLNIRHQVLTFLIAGHETTSGALAFALHHLARNPAVLARARAEVDALWGDTDRPEPAYGDIGRLGYLRQVLDESLRLWPTAPAFALEPIADTTLGGYPVRRGESLMVLTPALHRDPGWGDNVELFDPERFAPERSETRSPHLFKPFGMGERACIGRQFALHEATLLLGLIVHRYRLLDDPEYRLAVQQTLTLKPEGLRLRLAHRTTADRATAEHAAPAGTPPTSPAPAPAGDPAAGGRRAPGTALTLLHGSNLGTCAGLARELAGAGADLGFDPVVASLDDRAGRLDPDAGPLVIVAASYNGRPTDDAAAFVSWLDGLNPGDLTGLPYAVLGVGDRNWAATYQRVPALVDAGLRAAGAVPLLDRGAADAAGDLDGTVDRWGADLWRVLLDRYGTNTGAEAGTGTGEATGDGDRDGDGYGDGYVLEDAPASVDAGLAAHHGLLPMPVLAARELAAVDSPGARSKRHLRLALPAGTTYRTGDHLAVLPHNPEPLVRRVLDRFGLDPERTVRLRTRRPARTALPVDRPLTLRALLTTCVELQAPAGRADLARLVEHTACPPERRPLAALAEAPDAEFRARVTDAGLSVLDLLERFPACELPFERYLDLLPVLRPRTYSISSSALATPHEVELMVSPLTAPHRSGRGEFRGVGSHHLAGLRPGDTVAARVLPCADAFRLADDPAVPAVLIGAGTGVAPFRGAVLDRLASGERGPLLCYLGNGAPDLDYLHREEFEAAQAAGAVSLRPAHSKAPVDGVRYVQDRVLREGAEVHALLEAGGRVHVCGDGRRMAPAVREAFRTLRRRHAGATAEEAAAWLDGLIAAGRYVEDAFAG